MSTVRQRFKVGEMLARYLTQQVRPTQSSPPTPPQALIKALKPGDVLLVESRARVATAVKYLTQSSWAHAALYVGDYIHEAAADGRCPPQAENNHFIEADLLEGIRAVPLSEFSGLHTRICRAVSLNEADKKAVMDFCIERIGIKYDLRNVLDLARYLMPTPPVPVFMRRKLLYLGSGEPTKAICSTLIAQAFQSVKYPILPLVSYIASHGQGTNKLTKIYRHRHFSLYTPRDFDVSPYFQIIKPTLESGFDHRNLIWHDDSGHMPLD